MCVHVCVCLHVPVCSYLYAVSCMLEGIIQFQSLLFHIDLKQVFGWKSRRNVFPISVYSWIIPEFQCVCQSRTGQEFQNLMACLDNVFGLTFAKCVIVKERNERWYRWIHLTLHAHNYNCCFCLPLPSPMSSWMRTWVRVMGDFDFSSNSFKDRSTWTQTLKKLLYF